ncbi:MAG: hypothetical protein ACFE91_10875 [Promethearchaeota archaeon]
MDEENKKLKKKHPIKYIFRFLFLIIGISIFFIGFFLFLTGFDFGILINDINISFIINVIIIIIGIIITSRFFIPPYYLRQNSLTIKKLNNLRDSIEIYVKFYSFAITRLIAAILLIIAGLISSLIFGAEIGLYQIRFGNTLILGSRSFFYISGLPALGIGFVLLFYFLLSPFKGIFSQSKNFYYFFEMRPLCPLLTEIPKKDIELIKYQNNHFGLKLCWIILLLPFIGIQLVLGIFSSVIDNTDLSYIISWTFIVISILEIIALVLLVMFQQDYFGIVSKNCLYELWFSPVKLKRHSDLKQDLINFLKHETGKKLSPNHNQHANFSGLDDTHIKLFKFIFALFLIIPGLFMATNIISFGPLFWWVALIYGFTLLVKSISLDFSKRRGDKLYYDEEIEIFIFQRNFSYKFHYLAAYQIESIKIRKWYRSLDFFDIFGLGSLLIIGLIQKIESWAIIDTLSKIDDIIISSIYMMAVIIFIFLYLCFPIDMLEIKTPSITYRIHVTLKSKNQNIIQKYLNNVKKFPIEVLKEYMIRTFCKRLFMILLLTLGSIIYSVFKIIYFI